jgi:glycosyltransferase involved in cell wall biosynthesis
VATKTTVSETRNSRVTIEEAYDGRTGTTRIVRVTAEPKVRAPKSIEAAYVKAAALAIKTANDPVTKKAALVEMAKIADRHPSLVREAMKFEFAKPKHSLAQYEAQLAKNLGAPKAAKLMRDLHAIASDLKARGTPTMVLVSATFAGGGVAEMFRTQAHILQQLGITVEWQKTWTYDDRYGEICRKAFDGFQGGSSVITDEERSHWRDHNALLAQLYQGIASDKKVGAIFLEDHHAIDLIGHIKTIDPSKRIVFRSHVDMAGVLRNKPAGAYLWHNVLKENLEKLGPNDVAMFQPGSVPPAAKNYACSVFAAAPGIDPLAPKNQEVSWENAKKTLQEIAPGINVDRPHIVAGGRFVPWKGLLPLLRAYAAIAKDFPEVGFLLFGTVGLDDWRKVQYNEQLKTFLAELEKTDHDTFKSITTVLNKNAELGSIYAFADHHKMFCALPSLAEGYNLMAAEASVQNAVPAPTFVGGLGRFATDPDLAPFGVDISDIVKKIDEPTDMYTIKDGRLIATPLAEELEARFAKQLRANLTRRRDDPNYADDYAKASKAGKVMAYEASLPFMSRDYLNLMAAKGRDLHRASRAPAPLGAPLLDVINEQRAA